MRIGVVGIGLMGKPIATRLVECGYTVVAYNRTLAKATPLQQAGITVAEDIISLITLCDVILVTVTDATAIDEIFFQHENKPGFGNRTLIQMGTISPSQSCSLRNKVEKAGGHYLEAPVLGSIPEAKAGRLLVMVGGSKQFFEKYRTLFTALGEDPCYVGQIGSAAALKLSLNQLIGALTTAFSTSLEFCLQHDVPVDIFMTILRNSALYAPTFDKKLQRMLDQNFEQPNFPTKHLLKDMNLFSEAAAEVDIDTSTSQTISHLIQRAMKRYANQDYSALSTAVKK